jgi:hypothetical protein
MSLTSFIAQVVVSVIIGQADNFEIIQLHTLKTSDFIGVRSFYFIILSAHVPPDMDRNRLCLRHRNCSLHVFLCV